MLDNCESTIFFNNLVEAKKETKNILIEEKKCKDLVIYFTRYIHSKSMKMTSLCYHELMRKVKEHEYFMIDDYV